MSKLYEALKRIEKKEEKKGKRGGNIPCAIHRRTMDYWMGGIVVFMIAFIIAGFILTRLSEKRKVASITSTKVDVVQQKKTGKVVESPVKLEAVKTPPKQASKVEKASSRVKKVALLPEKIKKSASPRKKVRKIVKRPVKEKVSTYDITLLTLEAQRATEKGEIEKAVEMYRKLLCIRKDDVYLMNNLGALYIMEGKYSDAQQILKKAYSVCTDMDIALNYASALYKGGDKESARMVLKHINPSLLKTDEQRETYRTLKHLLEGW